MIDIENDLYTAIERAVMAKHPSASVSNQYEPVISSFPAVTVLEMDNSIFQRMRTLNIENAVRVMYEVNIYSNAIAGKKTEAKAIAETVDNAFLSLGFTRTMKDQIPNFQDAKIYRILCRYEAVVGRGDRENAFLIYQNQ